MAGLPPGFFDKPSAKQAAPDASSASLSGREHIIEGFLDAPKPASAAAAKRKREEEEREEEEAKRRREEEAEEMEAEEEEDDATRLDRMLDEAEPVEVMDLQQLRRTVVALERKLLKNQEMRVRHSDEPAKFMDSEIELFEELNKMQSLATVPELYTEFVKLNGVQKVVELMDHENVDVALAAVELINELTDPEALTESEESAGAQALVDSLVENSAMELLVRILGRVDESESDGQQGVYNTLAIFENLSEIQPKALEAAVEKTDLIEWLFKRLKQKAFDQNKLYSSEILSILCQSSEANQRRVGQNEGMDKLLQLVAPWKKKDPPGEEEAELISNIFNVICSALMITDNQTMLVEGEGIELMVIIMQFRKFAARCALKVLDYAMLRNTSACERFVNAMGLKTLFPAFMKPSSIYLGKSKEAKKGRSEDEEHVCSIISSLLLRLSGENHARVLNKFLENGHEKVDRLMELHEKYYRRVQDTEEDDEDDEEDGLTAEDRKYMARLDKGLYTLQQVDVIIGFLLTESISTIETRVKMLLHQNDADLSQILGILKEYRANIGDEKTSGMTDVVDMKEVLEDLSGFVEDFIKTSNANGSAR